MGQYTVYCNDNANFKNVANGTGELRIQDTSMRADGVIYFDTASVQEGDVLESSPSLMLYCQAERAIRFDSEDTKFRMEKHRRGNRPVMLSQRSEIA